MCDTLCVCERERVCVGVCLPACLCVCVCVWVGGCVFSVSVVCALAGVRAC